MTSAMTKSAVSDRANLPINPDCDVPPDDVIELIIASDLLPTGFLPCLSVHPAACSFWNHLDDASQLTYILLSNVRQKVDEDRT